MSNAQKFIEHCEEHGFIGFSYTLSAIEEVVEVKTESGKKKIGSKAKPQTKITKLSSNRPVGWNEDINADNWKSYVHEYHNAFAILTGEKSNVTILDFDDKESLDSFVLENPKIMNSMYDTSRKGIHVYTTYEPQLYSANKAFEHYLEIDIKNDKSNCTTYPTTYFIKMLDGTTQKVEYTLTNDRIAQLAKIKQKLIPDQKKKAKADAKSSEKKKMTIETNDELINKFFDYAKLIMNAEPNRDNWRDLCFIHKRCIGETNYEQFDQFCSQYDGYDEVGNQIEYDANDISGNGYGWKHLYELATKYNLEEKLALDIKYADEFNPIHFKYIVSHKYDNAINELNEIMESFNITGKTQSELRNDIAENKRKLKQLIQQKENETNLLRKKWFEKFHAKILAPTGFIRKINGRILFKTEREMQIDLRGLNYTIGENKTKQYWFGTWLDMPDALTYTNVDFYPRPLPCPEGTYNTFTGLEIDKIKPQPLPVKNYSFQPILDHFSILTGHEKGGAEYLAYWYASKVANPGTLTEIFLFFQGNEGSGKTQIHKKLGYKLFGEKYVYHTEKAEQLFGKFGDTYGKLLVICDEFTPAHADKYDSELKMLTTEKKLWYERKGKSPEELNNCAATIIIANKTEVFGAGRRNGIFQISDEKIGDYAYFDYLYDIILGNDIIIGQFRDYLMSISTDNFNLRNKPITKYATEMIIEKSPMEAKYIWERIEDFELENKITDDSKIIITMNEIEKYVINMFSKDFVNKWSNKISGKIIKTFDGTKRGRHATKRFWEINVKITKEFLIKKYSFDKLESEILYKENDISDAESIEDTFITI